MDFLLKLPQRIARCEADVEANAEAGADAQFLGLDAFPVGHLATSPAPLALTAAPVSVAAAPVAVAPQCQQKVDIQCRQVPVQAGHHMQNCCQTSP